MCSKAQRDSPVHVLLAPPGEYDRIIKQLEPSEDFHTRVEKTVATTVQSKIQQQYESAISMFGLEEKNS